MSVAINVTASWFNGRASAHDIRRALILGAVPRAVSVFFYFLMAVAMGHSFFDDTELPEATPLSDFVVILVSALLIITLTIWSIIVTSQALAEVQGYRSAWKAWLHCVVAFLCLVVVFAVPLVGWMILMKAA